MSDRGQGAADGGPRWEALRRRLEGLRDLLAAQGSLVRKQRRAKTYWYLRFTEPVGGVGRQRSVYVGGEAEAARVVAWLGELRAPDAYLRESLALAGLALHLGRALRRRSR